MELQLELALSTSSDTNQDSDQRKKRSLDDAFSGVEKNRDAPQTLPLFIWKEYEEEQNQIPTLPLPDRNDNVENDLVVGWPPVKSWRKQLCQQSHRGTATNYVNVENAAGGGGRGSNSTYVKVKMEGVGIARKIDLRNHNSYQTLIASLITLFGQCEGHAEMYRLTYQDKEGDWLLAGDAPWETFKRSARRLKLQKNGY
ncbi:hypothetical protein CDL12_12674 [Handroanthus impetiginosus]|uniref:Auxin-responsive protein n=1 Tax=Handroanthus impetiginosus TaxID=429701 RepID=A0A2G9HB01_9LAMI|nr:hypothetical protein CDL12_12674 [Handroanthus impetiginosus]